MVGGGGEGGHDGWIYFIFMVKCATVKLNKIIFRFHSAMIRNLAGSLSGSVFFLCSNDNFIYQ